MPSLKQWLINAREGATAQSTLPSILALVMAIGATGFNVWLGLLAVLGVKCAHLAMNLIDDLFDYKADLTAGHAKFDFLDPATAGIGSVPLHPGAEKYYKEIGVL